MLEIIKEPWPWYVAGPLIGLTVPALLILGNKSFGISSSLRHILQRVSLPISVFSNTTGKKSFGIFFLFSEFF